MSKLRIITAEIVWNSVLVAYFWLISAAVLAQSLDSDTNTEPDQLYVHIDKSFYTTGETIWYKTYFLYQDTSEVKSNIIYLDLISPSGEILVHQKLLRKLLHANGEISILPEWKEGYYTLRCYTRWNLNFGYKVNFLQHVPIYNPYNKSLSSASDHLCIADSLEPSRQELTIIIQTTAEEYTGRMIV